MKLAARAILLSLLVLPLENYSQGNQELLEEIKHLAGEVADLREANSAQDRRIGQMQKEIDTLRGDVRESRDRATSKMGDFATRDDLKKMVENIREVDQRRESDRKLILGEFEKLGKTLSQPAERAERSSRNKTKEKEHEPDKEAASIEVLSYKVKDGQRLSDILKEYNGALKEQGRPPVTLEQVKRANPKININRIVVGQEVLLPVPEKKK
jgi:TolA-binding protein